MEKLSSWYRFGTLFVYETITYVGTIPGIGLRLLNFKTLPKDTTQIDVI